jgi:hypothetical protein
MVDAVPLPRPVTVTIKLNAQILIREIFMKNVQVR